MERRGGQTADVHFGRRSERTGSRKTTPSCIYRDLWMGFSSTLGPLDWFNMNLQNVPKHERTRSVLGTWKRWEVEVVAGDAAWTEVAITGDTGQRYLDPGWPTGLLPPTSQSMLAHAEKKRLSSERDPDNHMEDLAQIQSIICMCSVISVKRYVWQTLSPHFPRQTKNYTTAQNRPWAPRGGACLVYGQCHNSLLIWSPYSPILWCTFWVVQFLWHTFEIILSILCVVFADMQKA